MSAHFAMVGGTPRTYRPANSNPAVTVSYTHLALIIALVVVVVVRFLIRSAVLQDSTALGTLAAAGASVPQTLAGIALPMAGMALVGAVAGVALSYACLLYTSRCV